MTHGGHVFITKGDITRLTCDAWLLPTDAWLAVTGTWGLPSGAIEGGLLKATPPDGWGTSVLSCPLDTESARSHGVPWMTCVGSTFADVDGYLKAITEFVKKASVVLHGHTPAFGRAKRLLAVPAVGTGAGGAAMVKGKV